jgi:hypothetical protein
MNLKERLVADWHWVVNHSWSARLIMLAFVLSAAEVIMPFFTNYVPDPVVYGVAMGLVTGAAFVARLSAQKRLDGEKDA